jgi:hypothetical protein
MSNMTETVPVAYESPREWLEGKRRLVKVLRQLGGGSEGGRSRRDAPAGTDREVLTAALNWHEEHHELRVFQTRAAGIKLPIDDFAAEFKLGEVEREIIELLLVAATDLTSDDCGTGLQITELVKLLSRGREDAAQEFLPYFLPGSRLSNAITNRTMFGSRRLSIDDDMVGRLLGVECGQSGALAKPGDAEASCNGDIAGFLSCSGVVLGASALESIRTLWGYVRRGAVIREKWGFGSLEQTPSGVCLLFHGPSGTGKTLTARRLSQALGREPLIVNYPDMVSKWVGETQKNAKAAFSEAARTGKVLVFDEADAIFARRTDVRNSTDRFANGEVNALLMELERFPGIVILTTNHTGVLDPALERRIRYKVYFGPPDAETRAGIWREHVPKEAPLAPDVNLGRLADEFKLTGGQIANAVLTAASLAASRLEADSANGQITMADFVAAARRELDGYSESEKKGRVGF